jgi:hypothetical protein
MTSHSKIAYLFLVYSDVYHPQVWEKYFTGESDNVKICCHAANRKQTTTPFIRNNLIPYWVSTKWAGLGLVLAHLELIRYALRDPSVQRLVLCSESCIPIKSYKKTRQLLFDTDATWLRTTTQYTSRMSRVTTIPKQHHRHHSQWVALTREHASMLVRFNFLGDFINCVVPDEHYVGSVLVHLGEAERILQKSQTYAQWYKLSPVQFTPREHTQISTQLIQNLKKSDALFARKFPANSCINQHWKDIIE